MKPSPEYAVAAPCSERFHDSKVEFRHTVDADSIDSDCSYRFYPLEGISTPYAAP